MNVHCCSLENSALVVMFASRRLKDPRKKDISLPGGLDRIVYRELMKLEVMSLVTTRTTVLLVVVPNVVLPVIITLEVQWGMVVVVQTREIGQSVFDLSAMISRMKALYETQSEHAKIRFAADLKFVEANSSKLVLEVRVLLD